MQEAGANLVQELAFTIADGLEYVRAAKNRGLNVDDFAPRLSFFFAIGMNFFMEAAKLRAARYLWSSWMKKLFNCKKSQSKILRTHCQTSGASLQEQDPYNNIIRTTIEALAAVLGGTQSLHTNSFDEAIALPTEFSSKIARNTQLILQNEAGITDIIDPLAGSYYVENLTNELIEKSSELIEKIEGLGGMTKAIISGFPKSEIEKSAIKKQARIDSGEEIIVGVNKYQSKEKDEVDILDIDNFAVRKEQIDRLKKIKNKRDETLVKEALKKIENAAKTKSTNLLELFIEAMRLRATLGETSHALEKVFGRHEADQKIVKNIYKDHYSKKENLDKVINSLDEFYKIENKNPLIYMAKLGQDGHDRGIKVLASAFSDFGLEVKIGDLFQSPKEAVREALKHDAHIIGISSLAAGHKTLIPELIDELKKNNAEDVIVICGGVIPKKDYKFLYNCGVAAIFGPGTSIPEATETIINKTTNHLKRMHNYRISRIKQ
tara:strand:- start:757 stop:2232 length:1476 start_codon:yes stop_codon:yes gene_type:complete